MTTRHEPLSRHALAAFLEGEVTPSEAAATEAQLRDSGAARRRLAQLEDIRRTLSRVPESTDQADRAAAAEIWQALERSPASTGRAPRVLRWTWPLRASAWLGAGACAAAAVLLILRGAGAPRAAEQREDPEEFRAKSAVTEHSDDRWVRIEALRVGSDGSARPLPGHGAVLRAHESLVFRYASDGPDPRGFLMVFAVDAAAQIHWYYPAYETAGTDPASVPIRGGSGAVALPDAIEHELSVGPLAIYGVFTRAPLRVLDVERRVNELLARRGAGAELPSRIPLPGAGQHVVRATVVP